MTNIDFEIVESSSAWFQSVRAFLICLCKYRPMEDNNVCVLVSGGKLLCTTNKTSSVFVKTFKKKFLQI